MATTLTPEQQLTAANTQYSNWLAQQKASGNGYTVSDINAQKAAILNTGQYPALDMGTIQPNNPEGQGYLAVNVEDSQFFISVQGGSYTPNRSSGYSGTPVYDGGGANTTLILNQGAAATQASQSGSILYSSIAASDPQAALQAETQSKDAFTRAIAAKALVDSGGTVADSPPTSSADTVAAADATNQKLGAQIDPNTVSAQQQLQTQSTQQTQNATRDAQLQAIYDNTAQSSGAGSTPTVNNGGSLAQTRLESSIASSTTSAVEPQPAVQTQQTISYNEDSNASGVQSQSSNNLYTDQQISGQYGRSSVPPDASTAPTTGGSNGVSLLKNGPAYGSDNANTSGTNSAPTNNSNTTSRPNKLHSYTNYTYRLSLYAVPRDTINAIFAEDSTPSNQSIINSSVFICSDSGIGSAQRSQEFPVDLTIDDLELESIVNSNNTRTRATDVIKLKFTIIEPYTSTFLGRLMKLSARINPNGNWSTLFFLLKIEFLGYNDLGQAATPSANGDVIPQTTKIIPFTMLNMDFDVNSSGSRYTCDCIPVNALALTALDNQIPFHTEVSGATINEIFNGGLNSTTEVTTNHGSVQDEGAVFDTQQNTVNGGNTTVRKGLSAALNTNEKQKVKQNTQGTPNTYAFKFDSKIGDAKVIDPNGYFKLQNVPGGKGNSSDEIKQGKVGSLVADTKAGLYRTNPGTRITDFINSIVTVSDYMTNQYQSDGSNSNQPLYTWKITPVVKFNDIDPKTNFYARDVTYVVKPFKILGQDAQNFGQAAVTPDRIVKTYKYTYSGQNQDVLEAGIKFQMAFFELKNGVPINYIDKDGTTPGASQNVQQNSTVTAGGSVIPKFFVPRYHYTNGLANRQNTTASTIDLKTIALQELMEKLYDNRGDMIALDITILGDPDWITQDYSVMHPTLVGDGAFLNNGSVNYANTVYFNFYFATPNADYNDSIGLFDVQGNYSEFSGIYQVVSVKSNFSGGKFTQKLNNFRVRNQQEVATFAIRNDSGSNLAAARNAENALAEKATTSVTAPNAPQTNSVSTNQVSTNAQSYNEDSGAIA
jgi:hypothetical protein